MHRPTLQSWTNFLLLAAFILPLVFPVPTDAARKDERPPLDLSILKQRDTLIPYMTTAQRIQYLELERGIQQAESDRRSGQYLADSKPTALDPDRDIKSLIKRGEALIEEAETTIYENYSQMVQMLKEIRIQKTNRQAVELKKYDYRLATASFEVALKEQARTLMEACSDLGYQTLFFDGIFMQDSEGLRPADAKLRNQVYDALVKLDGENFSLKIPVDFQLKPDTKGQSGYAFSYKNAGIFENDKKALLALELIVPEGSNTGLFSLRAIDLDTQQIATQILLKIDNLTSLLDLSPEGLADRIPADVEFRDPEQKIELFARLSAPYSFQLTDASKTGIAATCLTDALLRNSKLKIVDSVFILEAYGESLEEPESWVGQANAKIHLNPTEEGSAYQVSAQANDSDRTLSIGTLRLIYPDRSYAAADAEME